MAYGWTEAGSLIRPLLTFRNDSYLIDQPAVRDVPAAGVGAACGDDRGRAPLPGGVLALVPKGEEPFSGVNVYRSVEMHPLYPPELRHVFAATHRLTETTKHYDVWTCIGQQ